MPRVTVLFLAIALAASIGHVSALAADHWTQWRGPAMTGVVDDDPALPERWSATENVAWKTAIPGLGWSSPVVWGNNVFVTTVVAREDGEKPRKGLYLPPTGTERMPESITGDASVEGLLPGSQTGSDSMGARRPRRHRQVASSPEELVRIGNSGDRRRTRVRPVRQPRHLHV